MAKKSHTFTWNDNEFPEWNRFYEEFRPRDDGEQRVNERRLTRWMRRELNALAKAYYAGGGMISVTVEPSCAENLTSTIVTKTRGEINALRWAMIPEAPAVQKESDSTVIDNEVIENLKNWGKR